MTLIGYWNDANHLPTPEIPLLVELSSKEECKAIRPAHVVDRDGDLGYVDEFGIPLYTVTKWRYL